MDWHSRCRALRYPGFEATKHFRSDRYYDERVAWRTIRRDEQSVHGWGRPI